MKTKKKKLNFHFNITLVGNRKEMYTQTNFSIYFFKADLSGRECLIIGGICVNRVGEISNFSDDE